MSSEDDRRLVGRRRFLQGVGAAGGAVAVGGAGTAYHGSSPVQNAEAALPIAAGAAGLAATTMVVRAVDDATDFEFFTADDESSSDDDWDQMEFDQKHAEIYSHAMSIESSDETVHTQLENNIAMADSFLMSEARAETARGLRNGRSQLDIEADVADVLADRCAVMQENLLAHWNQQMAIVEGYYERDPAIDGETEEIWALEGGDGGYWSLQELNVDLLDDRSYTILYPKRDNSSDGARPDTNAFDHLAVRPVSTGSDVNIFSNDYYDLWTDIENLYSQMVDNAEMYIDGVYAEYQDGDLDDLDILGGHDLAQNFATDYDDTGYYAYAGGDLAALGIPSAMTSQMQIELHDTGSLVFGAIYTQWEPEESDDEDGAGYFDIGTQYDPSTTSNAVYLAYEGTDEDGETVADITELNEPFTIVSATDPEGNEVDTVSTERVVTDTTDHDLKETREEIARIQQLLSDLEDRRAEERQAAGGGGFNLGGQTGVIAVAAAVAAAFLYGK